MRDLLEQFFTYKHLPEHLQKISKPFSEMAQNIIDTLPRNPQRTAGLWKLLEAKDCIVRAALSKKVAEIQCGYCGKIQFIDRFKKETKIKCESCDGMIIIVPRKK